MRILLSIEFPSSVIPSYAGIQNRRVKIAYASLDQITINIGFVARMTCNFTISIQRCKLKT